MDKEQIVNDLSIIGLDNRPVAELRALFRELLGTPPPRYASAAFLAGNIAWTVQTLRQKQDAVQLRSKLLSRASDRVTRAVTPCQTGTRLVREWQGETFEITVLEDGFRWQGRHYRSLSRIAREITGARWSGPRFFGLRGNANG